MSEPAVSFPLAVLEGLHLTHLVDDFSELVSGSRDDTDPAIDRLAPTAYPNDQEAASQFAVHTRDDLLDRRLADAVVMRQGLHSFDVDPGLLSEREARATKNVTIATADVDAWLRTLTAIRLVIASRLEITDDEHYDEDDPRYGVYSWLGYRLELLIEAADELDGF